MPRNSTGNGKKANKAFKSDPNDDVQEQEDSMEEDIAVNVEVGHSSHHHRGTSPNKKKRRRLDGDTTKPTGGKGGGGDGHSSNHRSHHHHHSHHPHRAAAAAAAAAPPVAAAGGGVAAAAAAVAPPEEEDPLLLELLNHFRVYMPDGGGGGARNDDGDEVIPHDLSSINVEKARNVLEATAGNVPMAAQLYWDDYFATQAQQQQEAAASNNRHHHENDDGDDEMESPSYESSGGRNHRGGNDDDGEEEDPANDDMDEDDEEEDDAASPHRKIRRSLDKDFGRAADPPVNHEEEEEEDEEEDDDEDNESSMEEEGAPDEGEDDDELAEDVENANIAFGRLRRDRRINNNPIQEADADNNGDIVEQRPRRRVHGGGGGDMAESVSVSDDEVAGGGVWRRVGNVGALLDVPSSSGTNRRRRGRGVAAGGTRRGGGPPPSNNHNHLTSRSIREAAEAAAAAVLKAVIKEEKNDPAVRSRRSARAQQAKEEEEDDEDDYISDSDWLGDDVGSLRPALDLLWGGAGEQAGAGSSSEVSDNDDSAAGGAAAAAGGAAEGNVIADDDDAEEEAQEENVESLSGIPHTWLKACFSLSSCGLGLEVKPPKLEDMELYVWRQQQHPEGRNNRAIVPPPYHCKAITAVLSIVTAMLHTGASVQGQEVNCTSARKPFAQLSEEDRKREFEPRLVDALTALIFIATKASTARKQKAYRKAKAKDPSDDLRLKKMQHKLRVIPTCRWRDDSATAGLLRQPESSLFHSIEISTSCTNIQDIRAYVLSTMRSLTASGGVALLLETILRIHGKGVVARMVEAARRKAQRPTTSATTEHNKDGISSTATADTTANNSNNANNKKVSLISCTCEERQKVWMEKNPPPASSKNDTNRLLDTTPPGHECMSVELFSLLLTGRVYSSWKGWSTQGLAFGVLLDKPGMVGWPLARPEKPVWVLRGETCYSVAWLEETDSTVPSDISKRDRPGTALTLTHWNCWYGQRNKSELRINTAPAKWEAPISSKISSVSDSKSSGNGKSPKLSNTAQNLLLARRKRLQSNIVSADEHEANEEQELRNRITEDEMNQAKAHPDDEQFYPDKYHLWRFQMGMGHPTKEDRMDDDDDDDTAMALEDTKKRAATTENWVPYHRLSQRQKMVIEAKLGPKIKTILWTRWPGSTIDNLKPADGPFPVV